MEDLQGLRGTTEPPSDELQALGVLLKLDPDRREATSDFSCPCIVKRSRLSLESRLLALAFPGERQHEGQQ